MFAPRHTPPCTGISWGARDRWSGSDPPEMPHEGVDGLHSRRSSTAPAGFSRTARAIEARCAPEDPLFCTPLFVCVKNWVLRCSRFLNELKLIKGPVQCGSLSLTHSLFLSLSLEFIMENLQTVC